MPSALLLGLTFLHSPLWDSEPWKTIAEQNTPGGTRINAPILIVQGDADHIVDASVTEQFVKKLCAKREKVDLKLYPGVAHLDTGHRAAPAVAKWIGDRFAGKTVPSTC